MTTRLKHTLSLTIVTFFIVLALASATNKEVVKRLSAGMIPPEYHQFNGTLLVIIPDEKTLGYLSWEKVMQQALTEGYKGKYTLITKKQLSEFPAERYPYSFSTSFTHMGDKYSSLLNNPTKVTSAYYIVTDRLKNKNYPSSFREYDFSRLVHILEELDNARSQ